MNPTIHANISTKRFGGKPDDYYHLHSFMDSSKEVEPTNIHRILTHHLWFVKNVVVPIYGGTFKNSDGKDVDVKDLCELDHILPDFKNKFVPSLSDYFDLMEDFNCDSQLVNFYTRFLEYIEIDVKLETSEIDRIKVLMLSPYANTGKIKSLYLTHNSWFVNTILPKIFPNMVGLMFRVDSVMISPSEFLNKLKYDSWIQNGAGYPKSFQKIVDYRNPKSIPDVFYDGAVLHRPNIERQFNIADSIKD